MLKLNFPVIGCFLYFIIGFASPASAQMQVEAQRWSRSGGQPWTTFETTLIDSLPSYTNKRDKTNRFGSSVYLKTKGTGFYRVEKINNRWWVIDPDGYCNIQRSVNAIHTGGSDKNKNAFDAKFKNRENWINQTYSDLWKSGFNGVGSWSDNEAVVQWNKNNQKQFSYTVILNLMSSYGRKRGGTYQLAGNTGYPNQCIFVFDPEFETFCDEKLKSLVQNSEDKNLLGYFSDNELPFSLKNLDGYLTLKDSTDPGCVFAQEWIKREGITKEEITDLHRNKFIGVVADCYYRIVSQAIKKYDPNHMYLGSRLHWLAKFNPEIVKAAGRYCDIVSINYYGEWTPQKDAMDNWGKWAEKPFMITEFYTKGMDSGLANTTGAGFCVRTQTDRGYAYQNFCMGLLSSPDCVGWHWFKYQDNDPTAKNVDPSNLDSNKGLLDNNYEWYKPLINKMKQLNTQTYSLINYFDQLKK